MKKRVLFPADYTALIGYVFLILPIFVAVVFAFTGVWWALLIGPFGSYFLYAMFLHRFTFRFISIGNGFVRASRSWTPIDPIQHRCNVSLSEIVIADFCFIQGNSKGESIYRAWDIPCLTLTLKDESIERIVLCGYSKKQFEEIEKALGNAGDHIIFDHKANAIIKFK